MLTVTWKVITELIGIWSVTWFAYVFRWTIHYQAYFKQWNTISVYSNYLNSYGFFTVINLQVLTAGSSFIWPVITVSMCITQFWLFDATVFLRAEELRIWTRDCCAVMLIWGVGAVTVPVAVPPARDAERVGTPELVLVARWIIWNYYFQLLMDAFS